MRTHNESSQVVVTASPKDLTGAAYAPTTARYKVNDCKTKKQLVGWTTLTPAASMQITIPGSANAIQSDRNRFEQKIVTVNTDNGLSTEHYEEYRYRVKNLRFVG